MSDSKLKKVANWFASQDSMALRFGNAIRLSFDEVFDGQRTGRYKMAQLGKVEKTYIGTKIEIIIENEFKLSRGSRLDYLVEDEEVDSKWSMVSGGWMIPTEAVGEICLCMTGDDDDASFSVGLVRADKILLGKGANKDNKRSFSKKGLERMQWLVRDGALPENLLARLDDADRNAIMDSKKSGQGRTNELFRRVTNRIIRREVVLTVARQDDGPKRVRDARIKLRAEGVLILGHEPDHSRIAKALGCPVPKRGEWVSCRVMPAGRAAGVKIGESRWKASSADEPTHPAPLLGKRSKR